MSALVDQFGKPVAPAQPQQRRADTGITGAPFIPDGTWNYGYYDAVNYSTNRAARPYFATDSQYTLTTWSRLRALSLARWAYINVHFVRGAVDLMARLSVGTGFEPTTHCKDKGLARAADDYYREKTANIGFLNSESIDELLMYSSRGIDVEGDIGYLLTTDELGNEKLQTIEAHRIKNGDVTDERCRDGVWLDPYGRKQAYNVSLPGEDDKTRKISAQDFIYLAEHNRPDELRSMTNLIHALAPLQDLYEILGFAMQSAKKNSEIANIIQTDTPSDAPLGPMLEQVMRDTQPANGIQPAIPRQTVRYEQVYGSGGKIVILRPGEEFKSFAHAQPCPTIEQWAEFIIRGIAVGFGVPFEVLWNPEAIGGANTRMILGLLAKRLEQRRTLLKRLVLNRVRFWILGRGIQRRELKFSPDLIACSWNPKFSDITVDAGRESREARANVLAGLDTFTSYFALGGENYIEEQLPLRVSEISAQCQAARELIKTFPELTFEAAMARIAMLTQNATEAQPSIAKNNNASSDKKGGDPGVSS